MDVPGGRRDRGADRHVPDEQTLYVASLDGTLAALDRAGRRRWSASLGDRVYSTPAVADDGTVFVGSDAQRFFAILPDGHVKWRLETKGDCDTAPVLAKDGTVVVAAGRDVLSVRSGGDVAWRFTAKRKVFASPAIADDGTVVVASQDDHVYALGPHGALVWSLDVGSDVDASPVILDDGTIAVGTDAGDVVLISSAGALLSRRALGGFVRGPLSAARDGDVLAGVYGPSPREARVGADGRSVGAFAVPGPGSREFGVHGGALEDDDGALVFGAEDDALYVVDATGALEWRFVTGGDVDAPATLLTDGSLVVGSDDGKVYLFAGALTRPRLSRAPRAAIAKKPTTVLPARAVGDRTTGHMVGIPPALDNDDEDVVWALQTAEALWKRNERIDAIVWLRRAAQSAGESDDDDRALSLAREAAELAEWVAANPQAGPPSLTPSATSDHPSSSGAVEDLLRASQAEIEISIPGDVPPLDDAPSETYEAEAVTAPLAIPPPRHAVAPDPSEVGDDALDGAKYDSLPPVAPSAAETHAGMLDPWSDGDAKRDRVAPRGEAPTAFDDEEVITSAPPAKASIPAARAASVPPAPPRPAPPNKKPVPPPPRAPPPALAAPVAPVALVAPEPRVAPAPPVAAAEEQPPSGPVTSPSLPPDAADVAGFDLGAVDAFADLPDDARAAFAAAATIHELGVDEEVSPVALALVLEGEIDVTATIVDVPAERLGAGAVLRTRGTLEHVTALRLRAATARVRVATWDDAAVAAAFGTCPWVEDDLRSAGDRIQALVGATMGALGERLDAALLSQVTGRLAVRVLTEGEVFVEKGTPVPGLLVVGSGDLEIVNDDVLESTLGPGDFLFATEVLSAGPAHSTARAGKGGALVLVADRHVAQELLVTCPPLLEIFAGM